MCYDEENRERPLGVNEAEAAWLEQMTKYRTAMNNDIYTNGGLLDNTTKFGFIQHQVYGSTQLPKQILENEFTYEELSFISRCRLANMTIPDIDRLVKLIQRFRTKLISSNYMQAQQNQTPYFYPMSVPQYSYNGWGGNAWLTGSSTSITETVEKPRRGRKPKKTDDVETEETVAEAKTETETEIEKKTDMDSLFAKINNDSI